MRRRTLGICEGVPAAKEHLRTVEGQFQANHIEKSHEYVDQLWCRTKWKHDVEFGPGGAGEGRLEYAAAGKCAGESGAATDGEPERMIGSAASKKIYKYERGCMQRVKFSKGNAIIASAIDANRLLRVGPSTLRL